MGRNNKNQGWNQWNWDQQQEKAIQRINATKSWFFEKINKIYQLLANLTRRKEKTQNSKIRDKKGDITTNTNEIRRIIIGNCEKPIFKWTGKSRKNE
jgi:hypothetical protein